MKKRVFVGIKISDDLGKEIKSWRKRYLKKLAVRLIKNKNLHLTLIPPWYESEVDQIIKRLRDLKIKKKSFEIKFDRVTFGPNSKRPRLIWAEGRVPRDLVELKSLFEKALNKKPEKREFKLHLTLARFQPKDFKNFKMKKLAEPVFWEEMVDSVCLFESKLLRTGAEYRLLKRVNFGG